MGIDKNAPVFDGAGCRVVIPGPDGAHHRQAVAVIERLAIGAEGKAVAGSHAAHQGRHRAVGIQAVEDVIEPVEQNGITHGTGKKTDHRGLSGRR